MTAKDYSLPFKDGLNTFINGLSNDQFCNLKLKQSYQNSSDTFSKISKNGSINKRKVLHYDFTNIYDSHTNNILPSWNKSPKLSSSNFANNGYGKELKNGNASNRSTLSLHIAAYENLNEANLFNKAKNVLKRQNMINKQVLIDYEISVIKNPFEFPRQQESDKAKEPEVAQYKSSQKLLNSEKHEKNESNNISYSSTKNEEDEDYRAHLSDPEETPTKVTGLKYGEQLTDDLLNSFCDKVQTAAGNSLEGFMAIQAIQLMPEVIPTIISGKKRVLQIILDSHRKHYILIEWDPKFKDRGAIIWDPLIRSNKDFSHTLTKSFKRQYLRLFDHIYGTPIDSENNNNNSTVDNKSNAIPCKLESFAYGQNDNWSCGLRAAALLVLRAFNGDENIHAGDIYISLRKFHEVLKMVSKTDKKLTKDDFRIDYWFRRKDYAYEFAFVTMNKSDLTVYSLFQNYDRKLRNYVKDDENDNFSSLKKAVASLHVSAKRNYDYDEDDESTLLSTSSSSAAESENEDGEESQAITESSADGESCLQHSSTKNGNNEDEDDEEGGKKKGKSLPSSSRDSSAATDDP